MFQPILKTYILMNYGKNIHTVKLIGNRLFLTIMSTHFS